MNERRKTKQRSVFNTIPYLGLMYMVFVRMKGKEEEKVKVMIMY